MYWQLAIAFDYCLQAEVPRETDWKDLISNQLKADDGGSHYTEAQGFIHFRKYHNVF